jgi:molybdate transport system regulatory protein
MAEFPSLSLRVLLARDTSLGPGKADLLQGIRDTGSIAAAGRRMGMSSKRAWYLIETMNSYFGHPLVIATKGGKTGGGGTTYWHGRCLLECYRRIEAKASRAAARDLAALAALAKLRRST